MAQPLFGSDAEAIKKHLTQGNGAWEGDFGVKFVVAENGEFNQTNFTLPVPTGGRKDGLITFGIDENNLLYYIFKRPKSHESVETDHMHCNSKAPGWSLPRTIIFPEDVAQLEAKGWKKETIENIKTMFTEPELLLHGPDTPYKITDNVVGVTVGKICGADDTAETPWDELQDVMYPDWQLYIDDQQNLIMGAIVNSLDILGQKLQGYTDYNIRKIPEAK